MNGNDTKSPFRLRYVRAAIGATAIILVFVVWPYTERQVGISAAQDISMQHRLHVALTTYYTAHTHYPSSLDAADFQPFLDAPLTAFIREGRITYFPPAADSPPTFIVLHLTTPRGEFSSQLDGNRLTTKRK